MREEGSPTEEGNRKVEGGGVRGVCVCVCGGGGGGGLVMQW